MDIDALHSTLVSLTLLPEELRSARETLEKAGGGSRQELVELLSSTERDLRIAKVTLARELGFKVCLCCWPPEVMVFHDNGDAYCPEASHGETAEIPDRPRLTPPTARGGGNPAADLVATGRSSDWQQYRPLRPLS